MISTPMTGSQIRRYPSVCMCKVGGCPKLPVLLGRQSYGLQGKQQAVHSLVRPAL